MSSVEETHSPFHLLLHEIGKELKMDDVRFMKYLLQGHINKETLERLKAGHELIDLLRKRRLVSEKKLAFLRKLLIEANCLKLVNLLDNFKEKFTPVATVGERQEAERASRMNNRRETFLRMIERVENEIRACEDANTEFNNQIKEHEIQIQANSENLVKGEVDIQFLKKRITENEAEIESFERKLETVRFFLKKHEVEIDKFKQKLQENKSSASIKRNLKEKQEEYEKTKKNEDELIAKHQKALDFIRTIYVEIRHKTQDLISLEDNIHDLQMHIRVIKQGVRKNQRTLADLHNKLENLYGEVEQTKRVTPLTPYSSRSQARISLRGSAESWLLSKCPQGYKVLDYGEISERESTVIGRKGKRAYPPQFQFPTSVAADRLGNIYVADHGNARIQVFDVNGNIARDALNMGGKCRPCALAVSWRGDLVVADCQILRLFSKEGELLRPILPVYSKNDRRPELSSVAFDVQRNIYVADKANHRIQKFTFDGNFLCFIGGLHDLHCPMGVIVRQNGDVIVTEFENHCLKIFSQVDLGLSKTIGSMGVGMGKFLCPRGLALDHFENIMVADSQNHRIQVISPAGESIGAFGSLGSDLGCLDTPYDVAMDTNGKIIVADAKNHRLQVFTRLVPVHAEPTQVDGEDCCESPTIARCDNEIGEGLGKVHVTNDATDTKSTEVQSNANLVYGGAECDTNQEQITEGTKTIMASDDNHINNDVLNSNNAPKLRV